MTSERNLAPLDELHEIVRPHRTGGVLAAAMLACAFALALCAPSCATAAAQLTWSAPRAVEGAEGHSIAAISCPSASLCVAVDRTARLFEGDPLTGSWSSQTIASAGAFDAVSCASASLCVAVDESGNVATSTDPAAGSWSPAAPVDGHAIAGVACPTSSLCVAVDGDGELLSSGNPAAGAWSAPTRIDGEAPLTGVSCAGESLCVAVDGEGGVVASASPALASSWHPLGLDLAHALRSVSCASAALCAATGGGVVFASANPSAPAPTWGSTPIDVTSLSGISCVSSGLCVALDGAGHAFTSDAAAGVAPGWTQAGSGPGGSPTAISCLAEGRCVAATAEGRTIAGQLPPPALTTTGPSAVTQTGATVSGTVDPQDAPLTSCRFEYGTTSSYGHDAPCASTPGPGSVAVGVSAQLSSLSPATLYHYRLQASSATGSAAGADGTFATAAPANVRLVHPAPYITGVPAVGDRLACNPGLPRNAGPVSLTYLWWRDESPIENSDRELYDLLSEDAGQHMQCEVIATNADGSASARSAFVTVPAEGVPASAGETSIGVPRTHGDVLQLPVACSPQADPECSLKLRLTAVETLRGRKLVAVSARRLAHRPPKARSLTVTLFAHTAHLPAGSERIVSMTLNAVGRRLFAKARRLPAQLTVEGTVLGVLSASLAKEQVTFGPAGAKAGRRGRSSDLARGDASNIDFGGLAGAAASRGGVRSDAAGAPLSSRPAQTSTVLTPTPYMGFDTYLALGPRLSESAVLMQASRMISDGLMKDGYRYLWLDVGWWQGQRNSGGEITVNQVQWPHGMAWLTGTLHRAGLLVGIYTDTGSEGCGGPGQGSYGHYQQDVNTFAAWGFDAVKVDFCGGGRMHLAPASAYGSFHAALSHNSSHRPMLLSICNFREPDSLEGGPSYGQSAFASYSFGPSDGNSWRTDTDVGFPGFVTFPWVLRNLDADAAHPETAGPGHWNDPDYLAPDQGLSETQFRTQMSMWAMLAAPLMASDNLTTITHASLTALQNKEVIAVDQDPAGIQGKLLASSEEGQVWVKPLYGGDRAVALLNRGSNALRISTSAAAIGMPHASRYRLRNLWMHSTTSSGGTISMQVPGESTAMLRVSAVKPAAARSSRHR